MVSRGVSSGSSCFCSVLKDTDEHGGGFFQRPRMF